MVALAVEPKSRADEQKIGEALHKLDGGGSHLPLQHEPDHARDGHARHERPAPAGHGVAPEAPLRRRDQHQRAAHRLPRDGHASPPTATTATRSRAAAAASSASATCASSRPRQGHGLVFIDTIVGGSIPRNLIPAVEKGMREVVSQGRADQQRSGRRRGRALRRQVPRRRLGRGELQDRRRPRVPGRLHQGAPVLLEPIVELEITRPDRRSAGRSSRPHGASAAGT